MANVLEAKKELLGRLNTVAASSKMTGTERVTAALAGYYLTCDINRATQYGLSSKVMDPIFALARSGHSSRVSQ